MSNHSPQAAGLDMTRYAHDGFNGNPVPPGGAGAAKSFVHAGQDGLGATVEALPHPSLRQQQPQQSRGNPASSGYAQTAAGPMMDQLGPTVDHLPRPSAAGSSGCGGSAVLDRTRHLFLPAVAEENGSSPGSAHSPGGGVAAHFATPIGSTHAVSPSAPQIPASWSSCGGVPRHHAPSRCSSFGGHSGHIPDSSWHSQCSRGSSATIPPEAFAAQRSQHHAMPSRHQLRVFMGEGRVEAMEFEGGAGTSMGSLEPAAARFLQSQGLKPVIMDGLLHKMMHMIDARELSTTVDLVDLI